MKNLLLRFLFAWKAFWLIPFQVQYEPLHYHCDLIKQAGTCDNEKSEYFGEKENYCNNKAEVAMSFKNVSFEVKEEDYYHVCKKCAKKFEGSKQKYVIKK